MRVNDLPPLDRIESIFHEALAHSGAEARERFVEQACAGDGPLLAEVGRVLHAHDSAKDDFLENGVERVPAFSNSDADFAFLRSEGAGDRIGRYKLLREIGAGGFGTVWLAEQETPVRRQVALKIIKLGMDTKEVIARFEQERQALALMDHPNIAKVLDAGATSTGRPFFVMELVHGTRVTDFCDEARLSLPDRLRLFVQVCQAVQHAHQKGIIHRDLKPSNVLVALHDAAPVPKVIDFGVAKATEQRLTDLTLVTRSEQMIGTPLYISPEQAAPGGVDVDTRSDIYSLGVLLFELLTGRLPFDPDKLMRGGIDEIRRVMREEEPPRPSMAMATLAKDTLARLANQRATEPSKLVARLRGDLDWIVMKALEKDRTRRYETAAAFAEDIRRHLTCEPVHARPPSGAYRFRRMARRNRLVFTVAAAFTTVLVFGIWVSLWQAIRANAALRELRTSAPAFAEQAHSLASEERFGEAIEKLDYALKLRPDAAGFLLAKANLLECQLRLAEAAPIYRAALRVDPQNAHASANLKLCEELLTERVEAAGTGTGSPLRRESLSKLYSALQREQRAAAELMPLARLLGEENKVVLEYWRARLSNLPIPPERPLSKRLTLREDGLLALDLSGTKVADLSALEGMPLGELDCTACAYVADLGFTRNMPLRRLCLVGTGISQLSSLTTLSDLEELRLDQTKVLDLDALRHLPLKILHLDKLEIQDLSALAGMPLEELTINNTRVTDLSPLAGMPLKRLELDYIPALDFLPLAELPLESLSLRGTPLYDLQVLRKLPLKELFLNGAAAVNFKALSEIKTIETLVLPEYYGTKSDPEANAIWELRAHPRLRQIGMDGASGGRGDRLRSQEQFWPIWEKKAAVVQQLRDFDTDVTVTLNELPDHTWELSAREARKQGGRPLLDISFLKGLPVTRLALQHIFLQDVSALAGMPLCSLSLTDTQVSDVSPLAGMPLEELDLSQTDVRDLSPLKGMPLKRLCIDQTAVADLSPLRGMALEQLWTGTTQVTDLSPLRGMPIQLLHIDGCPKLTDVSPLLDVQTLEQLWLTRNVANVQLLRQLPHLRYISYEFDGAAQRPKHTAEEFWSMEVPDKEQHLANDRKFADLERLLRSRLNNRTSTEEWSDYLKLAAVILAREDHVGYCGVCAEMRKRVKAVQPFATVRICALAPDSGVSANDLQMLLDAALSHGPAPNEPWVLVACALVEYRCGNWSEAERYLRDYFSQKKSTASASTAARVVLAMIRSQQKDSIAAIAELKKATDALDNRQAHDDYWSDWLMTEALVKEARQLVALGAAADAGH